MIISHKYKFIFLKTSKTGGTSIEIALSKHCGPDDIITRISPRDEETRQGLGYRGAQNYLKPIWDGGLGGTFKRIVNQQPILFYNHISAFGIKALIGETVWQSYYKFCFERNPWDRVISQYYWRNTSEPRPEISEFVASGIPSTLKRRGFNLYTIDGEIAVDKICRYENIDEEMEMVRSHLGIPEKLALPRAKSQYRKDRRGYREILGETEKLRIAELFRDEINLFGYKF